MNNFSFHISRYYACGLFIQYCIVALTKLCSNHDLPCRILLVEKFSSFAEFSIRSGCRPTFTNTHYTTSNIDIYLACPISYTMMLCGESHGYRMFIW